MVSKISAGVLVAVECSYEPELSNPMQSENMFSYKITIENQNPYSVKLLRRHWYIFDSLGDYHEVEGGRGRRIASHHRTHVLFPIHERLQPEKRHRQDARALHDAEPGQHETIQSFHPAV